MNEKRQRSCIKQALKKPLNTNHIQGIKAIAFQEIRLRNVLTRHAELGNQHK